MFTKFIDKIKRIYFQSSSLRYVEFLRKQGVSIGDGTVFFDPKSVSIDISRPCLLTIGKHVFIHKDVIIMTHDWASWCFVHSHNEFIPSHASVVIGDNVWFGMRSMVLKGVKIGNNVIVGAGSIVTKDIPSNSVAVGCPARVICSYEEYLQKRRTEYPKECMEYARCLKDMNMLHKAEDLDDDYTLFVNSHNYMEYKLPYSKVFNEEQFESFLANHKSNYSDFNDFFESL